MKTSSGLLVAAFLAGFFNSALSCMQTGSATTAPGSVSPGQTTPGPTKPQTQGPFERCGGKGGLGKPPGGYFDKKGGGPISKSGDLDCDFDNDCCWTNEQAPADQLEWLQASGDVDSSAWNNCFGTNKGPSGKYLVLPVDAAARGEDDGQWYSCSIACAQDDIKVTLNHWSTEGVKLRVCEKDAFDSSKPLSNCKSLDRSKSPGPTTVTLPKCSFCDIVIDASNYVSSSGGLAAVDNIKVKVNPCTNKTTTPKPVVPGGGGACEKIACNFEKGNQCGLQAGQGTGVNGSASPTWGVQSGRLGNRDTGVPGAGEGNKYLGTQLVPGQTAVLQSGDLSGTEIGNEPRVLVMKYYEATDGITLEACKDGLSNCQPISNPGVSVADRGWQEAQITIPKGTKTVSLVAKNTGSNLGAVGIDELTLANPTQPNGTAGTAYCPQATGSRRRN